jgi:CheY-like chemotaxis protein
MNKVLIVDDDLQLLTILTETLKKYRDKFEIITANDGLVAIKALQKLTFSVVVTDIKMPKVNGLVLLAYLAKNFPQIPCILMTGYGTPFLKKRLEQEASHYIEKPFEIPELGQAIISALGQQENLGGTLNGVSVASFLKLVEMEYMTCFCEICSPDNESGYLLFDGGVLWNAFFGNLRGEKAALKLLQMKDVTINFRKPPKKKVPRRIETELSALLIEAMKSNV